MTNPYLDQNFVDTLQNKFDQLMEEKRISIINGERSPYSIAVHEYLQDVHMYGVGVCKRHIILPASHEEQSFNSNYCSLKDLRWPIETHYNYSMDFITTKNAPGYLYFGYALCEEALYPCAFFVRFKMVGVILQMPGEFFPEEFAIDPIAFNCNKMPDCYCGVLVPLDYVEQWLLSGGRIKHPLENCVIEQQKNQKEESEWNRELLMGQQEMVKNSPGHDKTVIAWLSSTQ